jgi:hypothetical protein
VGTRRRALHPSAVRLLVSADGGGANGYRTRLWKTELAALATRQTPYQPDRVQRIGRNYAVELGATDADGPLQASTLI